MVEHKVGQAAEEPVGSAGLAVAHTLPVQPTPPESRPGAFADVEDGDPELESVD